jgi:hypothetical protein
MLRALHKTQSAPTESVGSSISGIINNFTDKAQQKMRPSAIIDNDVTNKISSAAKDIGDALNNFGAQMFGGNK